MREIGFRIGHESCYSTRNTPCSPEWEKNGNDFFWPTHIVLLTDVKFYSTTLYKIYLNVVWHFIACICFCTPKNSFVLKRHQTKSIKRRVVLIKMEHYSALFSTGSNRKLSSLKRVSVIIYIPFVSPYAHCCNQ